MTTCRAFILAPSHSPTASLSLSQDKIKLLHEDLESERELRQRVSDDTHTHAR